MNLHIPFALPDIGSAETLAVNAAMASGWLSSGPEMRAFETDMQNWLGEDTHCTAVNSATSGLFLALKSLGLHKCDKVLVPDITFAASISTVFQAGGTPMIVDVDDDQNMSLETLHQGVARAAQEKTGDVKAIVLVHFAGKVPRDYKMIREYCKHAGIFVIEDAAHSFGAKYGDGTPVGSADSHATVFSFYATKNITTGEGGMICSRSGTMTEWYKRARMHGISRDVFDRYSSQSSGWEYDITMVGWKFNMPDTAAAMGRIQLKRNGDMLERRRYISQVYSQELPREIATPTYDKLGAFHLYPVRLADVQARDEFMKAMGSYGIGMSMHFKPLHRLSAYQEHENHYPVAEQYWQTACSLPLYSKMTDKNIQDVINAAWEAVPCLTVR